MFCPINHIIPIHLGRRHTSNLQEKNSHKKDSHRKLKKKKKNNNTYKKSFFSSQCQNWMKNIRLICIHGSRKLLANRQQLNFVVCAIGNSQSECNNKNINGLRPSKISDHYCILCYCILHVNALIANGSVSSWIRNIKKKDLLSKCKT